MKQDKSSFKRNLQDTLEQLRCRMRRNGNVPIHKGISVSFEFFPPRNNELGNKFAEALVSLDSLAPEFVSVTYGAGGSQRNDSFQTLETVASRMAAPRAAHLACIDSSKREVEHAVQRFAKMGIDHLVALRGDRPDQTCQQKNSGEYRYASELVSAIRKMGDFRISVAAYPETHPEAKSWEFGIDVLKAKQDAGADQAITQYFFDTGDFLRFRDAAVRAGVVIPIIPGILPVNHFEGIRKFSNACGASIPGWMDELFGGLDDAPDIRAMVATTVAAEQCAHLIEHGVTHLHFYTLNRSELTRAVCRILGVRENPEGSGNELVSS